MEKEEGKTAQELAAQVNASYFQMNEMITQLDTRYKESSQLIKEKRNIQFYF